MSKQALRYISLHSSASFAMDLKSFIAAIQDLPAWGVEAVPVARYPKIPINQPL